MEQDTVKFLLQFSQAALGFILVLLTILPRRLVGTKKREADIIEKRTSIFVWTIPLLMPIFFAITFYNPSNIMFFLYTFVFSGLGVIFSLVLSAKAFGKCGLSFTLYRKEKALKLIVWCAGLIIFIQVVVIAIDARAVSQEFYPWLYN